ncbi:hypothetical protein DZC71_07500 [Campylobacter hepaticus]|uniref:Uncharacterized protein n=1 Tax=Campylobacter hepaticus TaxID=1813019 RepID=A0A424YYI2_9BACT|nr:hypothetical protein [Campylobacter hepaticus]RQD66465.1 hypothetical protein DZC71_07500 [Campylobacter hepaticus]RQD85869.1 hypothetical protein DZD40_07455 [Campylobacter hepaticus]RQD86135.1 hypothetical protein DZD40_07005 [Campylobacter hepaticus]
MILENLGNLKNEKQELIDIQNYVKSIVLNSENKDSYKICLLDEESDHFLNLSIEDEKIEIFKITS